MTTLQGRMVTLRPPTPPDIAELARIREAPEVYRWWRGGDDLVAAVEEDLAEQDTTSYVIEYDGRVAGWVQWGSEDEPDYRHANIDIYLDVDRHGRGLGGDALHTLARHLIDDHGYHRIEIDPASDNLAAIRCYEKVGFRRVGILRKAERGTDGSWHDSLLLDLLAEELVAPGAPAPAGSAPGLPRDRASDGSRAANGRS